MSIPRSLAEHYAFASPRQIRAWSYGALRAPRNVSAGSYRDQRGTLHDQGIFGPTHDFHCACGKYDGERFQGVICDICGVKLARSTVRRTRFAYIELSERLAHPFAQDCELQCFPVLPAAFIESLRGAELGALYDQLVIAANDQSAERMESSIGSIIELLTPIVISAHEWALSEAAVFARGLALEPTDDSELAARFCQKCGYPLAGLRTDACPGCGARQGG